MKRDSTDGELRAQIAERQRADQALQLGEELNRRIIEAVPCGIVVVSRESAILKPTRWRETSSDCLSMNRHRNLFRIRSWK